MGEADFNAARALARELHRSQTNPVRGKGPRPGGGHHWDLDRYPHCYPSRDSAPEIQHFQALVNRYR